MNDMSLNLSTLAADRYPLIPGLDGIDNLNNALDAALHLKPQQAADLMRVTLYMLYRSVKKHEWKSIVHDVLLRHPIKDQVHKDPFTWRAFNKPRGYAGDAVMIDYIYNFRNVPSIQDETGKAIFSISTNSPSSRAVRNRLNFIVNKLDQLYQVHDAPEVFSLACGHCREFESIETFNGKISGRFVAMDQDKKSLETVEREYGPLGINTLCGSVTSLIKNKGPDGNFDLIYALGLYDYLNQRLATRLTANLFNRLHSGGELVIANFMPDILDVGYMESYMAWELIHRDQTQMKELAGLIKPSDILQTEVFTEPERNIVIMSVKRK